MSRGTLRNFNSVAQRKDLIKSYEKDEVCYAICVAAHEMMLCRPDYYKSLMDAIRGGVDGQYEFDRTTRAQLINDNEVLRDSKLVRHYIAAAMGEKLGKHIELNRLKVRRVLEANKGEWFDLSYRVRMNADETFDYEDVTIVQSSNKSLPENEK